MLFAEETEAVDALDRAIRAQPAAVVDAVGAFLAHAQREQIVTLTGVGLPLRPCVISRTRLDAVSAELFRLATIARDLVVEAARAGTAEELGIPAPFLAGTDLAATLRAPHALATMRPDGFWFPDTFALTELNAGNGVLISCAYASAVHRFFADFSPVVEAAGLPRAGLVRSFDGLAAVLRGLAGQPAGAAPRVALLLPQVDCLNASTWGEKVHAQLSWAPKLLREAGFDVAVVDETGLVVGQDGRCRTTDGVIVDVVYLATTGLGFFEEPARLRAGEHSIFGGTHVGHAPLVLPVGALAMEKGVLAALCERDVASGPVSIQYTAFAKREHAAMYRLEKDALVIKRAFRDKHTFVGCVEPGRTWNRYIEQILDNPDYVLQEYVSMPTSTMPVLVDGKHIEWLPVRVELSPFLFGGRPWGAMCRYAPDGEGLILSPPPPDMGFGMALVL